MREYRMNAPTVVHRDDIQAKLAEGGHVIIQFPSPPGPDLLRSVNALCAEFHVGLDVRFYAFDHAGFDARILRHLPDVRNLSLDCLMTASHLEALRELQHLQALRLGIYGLDIPAILSWESLRNLHTLSLGEGKKSNIDLGPLADFPRLTAFSTVKHATGIDVLRACRNISHLRLTSIPATTPLGFLAAMKVLTDLYLGFGSRTGIPDLSSPTVKNLQILRVRGLDDLGDLGRFPALEKLQIEDQKQLTAIDLSHCDELETLVIINCSSLTGLHGLAALPQLHELRISRTAIDHRSVIASGLPKSLRNFAIYTHKAKLDATIKADLARLGFASFPWVR